MTDQRIQNVWNHISRRDLPRDAGGRVALVSYPDDEGVMNNKGRPGAKDGPERVLHYLGRFIDRGFEIDVIKETSNAARLVDRHKDAEDLVRELLQRAYRVVTIGGGHDYGFPDASAYHQEVGGKIVNVDQHLDVRPVVKGVINSGTPFFRYVERFGGRSLVQWGIQEQCNTEEHLEYCRKNGVRVYFDNERLPNLRGEVGLSVCIDAFEGIRAVSAPAIVGLNVREGLEFVDRYAKRSRWLGLYEVAPCYDPQNEDAARYAALLAYRFLLGDFQA